MNIALPKASGFVWRLQTEDGDATAVRGFDDDRLVEVVRRRREWMQGIRQHMVLWWVEAGHIPTVAEAEERLEHLRAHGPSPFAFSFKSRHVGELSAQSCNA